MFTANYLRLRQTSVYLALVPLLDMWTPGRWGPEASTLPPAAHAKAAQLGQKLSIGLEAAYQVNDAIVRIRFSVPARALTLLRTWSCSDVVWRYSSFRVLGTCRRDTFSLETLPCIFDVCGPDERREWQKKGERRLAQQHQTRNVEEI